MQAVSRGEIYYIEGTTFTGSEVGGNRPAIIVSNNTGNVHSSVVEVVYLTTKPKKPLPTHVQIFSSKVPSTALCEQIVTVSKDRIKDRMGALTEKEMQNLDAALIISLGLADKATGAEVGVSMEVLEARIERNVYRELYLELLKGKMEES